MAIEDRVARDRAARRALIVATARDLAERSGWDAVTTRRLSTEIEYSQPVLYKHFASMEDIMDAVALEGFTELAEVLAMARRNATDPADALSRVAHSYNKYAVENPALYDAMFTRSSRLQFRSESTPALLHAAFVQLSGAVAAALGREDVETLTELLWAALHGLTTLGHNGRLRPALDDDRINLLVSQFLTAHAI
jgi:AcrR family transcriptional regulator